MQIEILIAGSGGQGIILLGNILGKAATLNGMFATQVSTHGSSQRGTPVQTEIIISDKPIDFAFTQKPDFFIIMSYRGFLEFGRKIVENTKVFIDSDRVIDFDKNYKGEYFSLSASTIAKEIGNPIVANLVMLGKFMSITRILPLKIIEEAIKDITPEKFIMKSLEALKKGYNL
jgi:2-oxoglutarate ferredoxin oxidoreductase subunit gamma